MQLVQGNTHAPTANGTAVLAISVDGLVLAGNAHGGDTLPADTALLMKLPRATLLQENSFCCS